MLLVAFIKFIHVLIAASLLGAIFICLSTTHPAILALKKPLILASLGATLTGALLVHPKHFTFHTPWIIVAFFGVSVFIVLIKLFFSKKLLASPPAWRTLSLALTTLLLVIIHDAVTKTTFL